MEMENACGFSSAARGMMHIVLAAIFMTLLSGSAAAELSCSVKASCTGSEVAVYSMYATGNSHACTGALCAYKVCCADTEVTLSTNCADPNAEVVLKLSGSTNAHAASPFSGTPYTVDVCLGSDLGKILCSVQGSCSETTCLGSISSLDNAHVGDCNAFPNKVCCDVSNDPPVVNDVYMSGSRRYVTFTSSVTDPDGDAIQQVQYQASFPGSGGWITVGVSDAGPSYSVPWDSYADGLVGAATVTVRTSAYDGISWGDYRTETFSVDNTPPSAAITNPGEWAWTGRRFDITWDGNLYAQRYYFEYVDRATFWVGGTWTAPPAAQGITAEVFNLRRPSASHGTEYCFRVRATDAGDTIPGSWSCDPPPNTDPSAAGCRCAKIDAEPPVGHIWSNPEYTNRPVIEVNWTATDEGAGVACYELKYRLVDSHYDPSNHLLGWINMEEMYDTQRLVYDSDTGSCSLQDCTTMNDTLFDHYAIPDASFNETDNNSIEFEATPIDAVYGCANYEYSEFSSPRTSFDWTAPTGIAVSARDADGLPLASPSGILYTPDAAAFSVSQAGYDYSGVTRVGVRYWLLKPGSGTVVGRLDGTELRCEGQTSCTIGAGPWYDDYNVSYRGYAVDRAGNVGQTPSYSFFVMKPMKLETDTQNVYLTLGTSRAVALTLSNRQNIEENISVVLSGYPYARFTEETQNLSSVIVPGPGALTVRLSPKQTQTIYVQVYTSEPGDDYSLLITANTTRAGFESKVEDMAVVGIRVVYPHEFPGPGTGYAVLAMAFSVAVYAVALYGGRRKEGK